MEEDKRQSVERKVGERREGLKKKKREGSGEREKIKGIYLFLPQSLIKLSEVALNKRASSIKGNHYSLPVAQK